MPKTRTTLTIDEEVLCAVKIRAAPAGKGDGQVIEEALRQDLGLDVLENLWSRNDLDEAESLDLAVEAQHATEQSSADSCEPSSTSTSSSRRGSCPRVARQDLACMARRGV